MKILAGSGPEEAYLNAQDLVVKLHYRTHEGTHLRFLQSRSTGRRAALDLYESNPVSPTGSTAAGLNRDPADYSTHPSRPHVVTSGSPKLVTPPSKAWLRQPPPSDDERARREAIRVRDYRADKTCCMASPMGGPHSAPYPWLATVNI